MKTIAALLVSFVSAVLLLAAPNEKPALEAALVKARVDGKYRMLLRQFAAPDDAKEHGDFKNLGRQARSEHAGQKDLPAGYWVYVTPHWYIWRERVIDEMPKRQWGPEQMTGPPDTWPRSGDQVTAWASLGEDDRDEWIVLEYPEPIQPNAVHIYETFNPGAVSRVSVFRLDGREIEVWKGVDPTPVGSAKGVSVIPFRIDFKTNRVKIELKSRDVAGWNEIDAVGLRADGRMHWASAADASTTYASIRVPAAPVVEEDDPKLDMLEKDVQQLKERVRMLEEKIRKRNKDKPR